MVLPFAENIGSRASGPKSMGFCPLPKEPLLAETIFPVSTSHQMSGSAEELDRARMYFPSGVKPREVESTDRARSPVQMRLPPAASQHFSTSSTKATTRLLSGVKRGGCT